MNNENDIMPVIVPVRDEQCEGIVIGTLLADGKVFAEIREYLTDDCFYNEENREIWKSIVSVSEKGDPINIITVFAELQSRGSKIEVGTIAEKSDRMAYVDHDVYAKRLQELAVRRRLLRIGFQLVDAGRCEKHPLDEVKQGALDGLNNLFGSGEGVFTLGDALKSLTRIINLHMEKGGVTTGTATGLNHLDEKGGLQPSDLIIIAGETSQGKTACSLSITHHAVQTGKKIAWYSMEMTKEQLAARLLSYETGMSPRKILYSGDLQEMELKVIDEAITKINVDNVYFDDSSTSNIETILVSIRAMKLKFDIDGAIVDYLQILNVNMKTMNKEQAMGDVARKLKNLAKDLGIWIIALSQLNRDRNNPEPNLNRLRDSGQIAEAADIVMFLYRAEYYNKSFPAPYSDIDTHGHAMIDIAKGRNIGTFKFICDYNNETLHFSDVSESSYTNNPFIDSQINPFEIYEGDPLPY